MKRFLGLAGLVLAGSVATANAATVTLDYTGQTPGAKNVYYSWYGHSGSASAGQFAFDIVGTGQSLLAWCVDLAHTLNTGPAAYNSGASLFGSAVVTNLDKLFTQHYAHVTDAVSSAAFQVAIWEIVYDSASLDLGRGAFKVTGSTSGTVKAKAADFLRLSEATGGYELDFLASADPRRVSQNLVTASPVPLPAAALMLGSGLLALFGLRRRGRAAA